MFETFNLPSLYAPRRTTDLFLDPDDGVTHTSPICERVCAAARRSPPGINGPGLDGVHGDAKKKIVRDIKEMLTYVALDIESAMVESDEDLEKTYELQDGNVIIVASVHLTPL